MPAKTEGHLSVGTNYLSMKKSGGKDAEYETFRIRVVAEVIRTAGPVNVNTLVRKYGYPKDTVDLYFGKMLDEGKVFNSGIEGIFYMPPEKLGKSDLQIGNARPDQRYSPRN